MDTGLGLKVHGILSEVGVTNIEIHAETAVQTATQSDSTAMILQVIAERIVAAGATTRAELDALNLPTLDVRLAEEWCKAGASFTAETIFGALEVKP